MKTKGFPCISITASQTNGRLITSPLKSAYVIRHLVSLPDVPASAVEEKLEELLG
jgi:hypothetical protein